MVVSAQHVNRTGPLQQEFLSLAHNRAWRVRTVQDAGYAQSRDRSASFNIGLAVWRELAVSWNATCVEGQRVLVRPAVFLVRKLMAAWKKGEADDSAILGAISWLTFFNPHSVT